MALMCAYVRRAISPSCLALQNNSSKTELGGLPHANLHKGRLTKQPTFREATTGFPCEMASEERLQKFYTDDVPPPLFGLSASDW